MGDRADAGPSLRDIEAISAGGERVTHLYPNDCYYAHLSIYCLASQFCQGGLVLDAGSGAGYGSAYLADHGARYVWGIDVSESSVAFSRHHFQRPNLQFQAMDLAEISGFPYRHFDVIFSSNVLEHVPDVPAFFRVASELLKTDGALIVAVPPITTDGAWAENIANVYHLNIWTPDQWHHVLNQYFAEIQPYRHGFNKPGVPLDFANTPERTVITEEDFFFDPVPLEHFYREPTTTAVFLARRPRAELPPRDLPLSFVDRSFTRPPPAARAVPQPVTLRAHWYSLRRLLGRAGAVAREQGVGAVIRKVGHYAQRRIGGRIRRG